MVRLKREHFVNVTIYDVKADLVEEFVEKVVKPHHSYGTSQAIKDLTRQAVQDQKGKAVT